MFIILQSGLLDRPPAAYPGLEPTFLWKTGSPNLHRCPLIIFKYSFFSRFFLFLRGQNRFQKFKSMWQRIQTLYLAIATVLVGSLFFSKVATVVGPEGEDLAIMYHEKVIYLLFTIMVFAANAIALVSFRARNIQMRLSVISALLLIAFQIWLGVDFLAHRKDLVFSFTAVFPLIAAILDLLAARNIFLDEAMVQAASRLRSSRRARQ